MEKYIYRSQVFEDVDELMNEISDDIDLSECFNDYLDDAYPSVTIYGYDFSPSEILNSNNCYYSALNDFKNAELDDMRYDIEHLCADDTFDRYGIEVECVDDEDEQLDDDEEDDDDWEMSVLGA